MIEFSSLSCPWGIISIANSVQTCLAKWDISLWFGSVLFLAYSLLILYANCCCCRDSRCLIGCFLATELSILTRMTRVLRGRLYGFGGGLHCVVRKTLWGLDRWLLLLLLPLHLQFSHRGLQNPGRKAGPPNKIERERGGKRGVGVGRDGRSRKAIQWTMGAVWGVAKEVSNQYR